jgi:hypothetical protein
VQKKKESSYGRIVIMEKAIFAVNIIWKFGMPGLDKVER